MGNGGLELSQPLKTTVERGSQSSIAAIDLPAFVSTTDMDQKAVESLLRKVCIVWPR